LRSFSGLDVSYGAAPDRIVLRQQFGAADAVQDGRYLPDAASTAAPQL
jgi:hypothetical protein